MEGGAELVFQADTFSPEQMKDMGTDDLIC